MLLQRLDAYARLMRLDKPVGTLLLLWPTLWALWIAAGSLLPHPAVLLIFVLGTILMRSAGCVINDWADSDFDGHVQRTRERPLVTGAVSGKEALLLASVLAVLAFLLILPLPALVLWLSLPALFLAASYPFTKRFLAIPQAYLGVAFGFGIPMAFAAQAGSVPALAWLLLFANVCWAVAYDTEYAMVDRDDDLKIGIRTAAITFGRFDVVAVMLCYALFIGLMALAGQHLGLGWAYYAGLLLAALIAGWHFTLIRTRSREGCFRAFRHNNWLGAAVFAGVAADHALRFGANYGRLLGGL